MKKIILIIIPILLTCFIGYRVLNIYKSTKDIKLLSEYILNDENLEDYTYKGNTKTNYLKYNNLIWRIVKVNEDKSVLLILDDYINILKWDDIDKFLSDMNSNLDTSYLKGKIQLLKAEDYINSVKNNDTFINEYTTQMWLSDKVVTNNSNLSEATDNYYPVKVTVTLKANTRYLGGNGLKESPIEIDEDKFNLGSHVLINNDEYIVIENKDEIKLMSMFLINDLYLNEKDEYLKKLDYKDLVNEVSLPSINDIKFDSTLSDYYLSDAYKTFNLVYSFPITYGDKDVLHKMRLVITVNKSFKDKLTFKDGLYIYGGNDEK